ncbi:hypothetical protein EV421DRAFT_1229876 [Armillaria borealis]|uniref:F-box domain-containing protein n=1 Tax=Armillaria borealis TaxID=47425 RepID=A0AA39J3N7_9AGAR|nr:hypothetical protein EV421DRAFT_1229876 [Armillaria borealis]
MNIDSVEEVQIRSTMSLSQPNSPISPVTRSAHTPSGRLLKCPECGYTMPGESLAPILPSSRFEELSSCNDPLVDSERAALEAVVREGRASLSSLSQHIVAVRETLRILLKDQARTVKHIREVKRLLSPVRRLPADVLIEIFTACLPEDPDLPDDTDSLDAQLAPWVLSQVCASWRQTALASTGLWANIRLRMDLYTNHMESVFRLGTVLDRAGERLLRVYIQGRKDFSDHPVFVLILSTSARWKSLDVAAPLHSFHSFNSISHHFPLLETLRIKVSSFHRSDIQPEFTCVVHGFRQAPRLRDLSVTQKLVSDMPFFPRLFALPLETISELHIESTASDVVSFLRSDTAKHLVSLIITSVDSKRHGLPQQIEIPVIRHDCLQRLCLVNSAAGLSRLQLPALRSLELFLFKRAILPTISEDTAPALTELIVWYGHEVDGRAMADILRWTPKLISLVFHFSPAFSTDTLFIALGKSQEGVFELVPHLKTMSFESARLKFSDHGRIVTDMIEARRAKPSGEGQATLKEVHLGDDLGESARWENLRQEGLIVHFNSRV